MEKLLGTFLKGPDYTDIKSERAGFYNDDTCSVWLWGSIYPDPELLETPFDNPAEAFASVWNKMGEDSFLKIDGDYTVIIQNDAGLTFFRDFKGAGPQIFYSQDSFAANPSQITEKEKTPPKPDLESLSYFLSYGYIPATASGLKGIKRIPPGYILRKHKRGIELHNLNREFKELRRSLPENDKEIAELYGELHKEAIRKRIKGKKKISLLLSGGYDSGGNLASLRDVYDGDVNAYTISFKDNPFSELEFVEIMAKHFNIGLKNFLIEGDELKGLPEILGKTGIPFQESGLMINYVVMKKAGEDKPDVVLGGDGNDQFFGTGGTEVALKHFTKVTGIILFLRLFKKLSSGSNLSIAKKINFYTDKIDNIIKPDRWGFDNNQLKIKPVFKPKSDIRGNSLKKLFLKRREDVDIPQTIAQVILFKASRMAETFKVPLTFPYLTPDIFGLLNSLPQRLRVKGSYKELLKGKGSGKYLHKLYFAEKLPDSITKRKKQGGFVPLSVFFNNPERNNEYMQIIESSDLLDVLLKNKKQVVAEMRSFLNKKDVWFWEQQFRYSQLLNLLVISVWEKMYVKSEDIREI